MICKITTGLDYLYLGYVSEIIFGRINDDRCPKYALVVRYIEREKLVSKFNAFSVNSNFYLKL